MSVSPWTPFVPASELDIGQVLWCMLCYGYMLFVASNLISDGSELLLLVPKFAPIVGSVVLPVLGAVPDGMMVFFSGLGPDAQMKVAIGVGALAGSTVMLLTIPWFLAVFSGRVSINENGNLNYKRPPGDESWEKLQPSGSMSLVRTGVTVEREVKDNSKIMLLTSMSYFLVQLPSLFFDKQEGASMGPIEQKIEAHDERWISLMGMCLCIIFFSGYLAKMWKDAQNDNAPVHKKIAEVTVDGLKQGALTLRGAMAQFSGWETLATVSSKDNSLEEVLLNTSAMGDVRKICRILKPFFYIYDTNGDGQIDFNEFCMICKDLRENLSREQQSTMFTTADVDRSGTISLEEFVACIMNFALDPNSISATVDNLERKRPTPDSKDDESDAEDEEDDMPEDLADLDPAEQQRQIKMRSLFKMSLGTLLVVVFSDPMVDIMGRMGVILNINSFYVSFVLAPIASNASELVAAYNYAKKRTTKSITTSLSTLIGAGIMNNTFCLGIFFALIFFKKLAWVFTAETTAIVLVEFAIAAYVLVRQNMRLLDALIILSFYLGCLGVVWFMENVLRID